MIKKFLGYVKILSQTLIHFEVHPVYKEI